LLSFSLPADHHAYFEYRVHPRFSNIAFPSNAVLLFQFTFDTNSQDSCADQLRLNTRIRLKTHLWIRTPTRKCTIDDWNSPSRYQSAYWNLIETNTTQTILQWFSIFLFSPENLWRPTWSVLHLQDKKVSIQSKKLLAAHGLRNAGLI